MLLSVQDGVVPMDDDDDEDDEEEEEEYLDDDASDDQWADADGMQPFDWEAGPAPGRFSAMGMHMQDPFDELPPLPSMGMRMDFGRMGGRRMQGLRMGQAPAAAAGVWDDAGDGLDGLPDPMLSGEQ
jgi:hypothetical protein